VQYGTNIITALTGIGGIMAAFYSGHALWAIPVIVAVALAAIFMVYSLRNHRWKSATFGLAVVLVVSVAGAMVYMRPGTTASHATTGQNNSPSASSPDHTAATTSANKPLTDQEVTLQRHDAVDVDQAQLPVTTGQSGVTGKQDLYFDPSGLPGAVLAYGGMVYNTSNPDITAAHNACADQFDPTSSKRNINPSAFLSIGYTFCFLTSERRMAWGSVVAVDQPISSSAAKSVTLHVMVWDK
jgi:hypothetical protein